MVIHDSHPTPFSMTMMRRLVLLVMIMMLNGTFSVWMIPIAKAFLVIGGRRRLSSSLSLPQRKTQALPSLNRPSEEEAFYTPEEYENYSRCMLGTNARLRLDERQRKHSWWWRARRATRSSGGRRRRNHSVKPGKLILLMHGESTSNANHTFTGWEDPDLSEKGLVQCQHAARLLLAEGLHVDIIYTSRLRRAIQSARIILEQWDALYIPVWKTYRLNARMYGAVQGLSKETTVERLGSSVVQAWRNSLRGKPPPLSHMHPNSPAHDRRYKDLPRTVIPTSESILDCQERARPLWENRLRGEIDSGDTILVVAHRDSLRGLIKAIEGTVNDSQTLSMDLPPGVPIVYRFDPSTLEPIPPSPQREKSSLDRHPQYCSGVYLEKPHLLADALDRQTFWREQYSRKGPKIVVERQSTVEMALLQLRREKEYLLREQQEQQHQQQQNGAFPNEIMLTMPWLEDELGDDSQEFEFFVSTNGGESDPDEGERMRLALIFPFL